MSQLELPSLLSYTRSLQPSMGKFYYLRDNVEHPITVEEITVRGSISDYTSGTGKNEKNLDTANIQRIDVAHLPIDIDTFHIRFTLTVLSNSLKPNSCNMPEFQDHLEKFSNLYASKKGYHFLAERYLENIINGRWLWRNRYAKNIKIKISYEGKEHEFPLTNHKQLKGEGLKFFQDLINVIAKALSTKDECINIRVEARGEVGHGQEIFPSQEFIERSGGGRREGEKSKELAKIKMHNQHNVAVMHSQKIGNALRTIDTWYAENVIEYPLAIEPYGIDQTIQKAKRLPKESKDLYSHLKNLSALINHLEKANDAHSLTNNDIHFVAACLIRGGVYSGESKNKDKDKKSKNENEE